MSIFRSVVTIGGLTTLSRIFGMIREILMSHFLGAGIIADAFVVAFKFPNFFRRFFAEGAFNAAFVPIFAGELAEHGHVYARRIAQDVFSVMAVCLACLCILVIICAPIMVYIFAPGFATTTERLDLAVDFTRITFSYMLFISLTALLGGILNSLEHFSHAAAAPILLNIFMIAGLVVAGFFGFSPGYSLSWSVCVAGIAQFIWLYAACRRQGFALTLAYPSLTPVVRRVLRRMGPGTLSAGITQVNIFVDLVIASFLPTGALSYLYYADRLNQLPLSIFGIGLSTALLPLLSKNIRLKDDKATRTTTDQSMRLSLYMTLPACVGLVTLAYPIIGLIYGHGKFDAHALQATAPTLSAFSFGLPAYVMGKVLSTCFFAHQDTKTPLKIAIVSVSVNILCSLLLMHTYAHIGLALATALAAWTNVIGLAWIMHKRGWYTLWAKNILSFSGKIIIACAVMGAIIALTLSYLPTPTRVMHEVILVLSLLALGGGVYIGMTWLLRARITLTIT